MKKKVSLIVLNYNRVDLVKKYFHSIINQDYKPLEIIFVDNGSETKEAVDYVKKYKNVKITQLKQNKGFAGGNNEGIKHSKGFYLLILNNDIRLKINFVSECVKIIELGGNIGMVSTKILLRDKKVDSLGINISKNTLPIAIKQVNPYPLCPCGGAGFYKKSVLEDVKLSKNEYFDEDYFAYDEDIDLGLRIASLGYTCRYAEKAICYHEHGATFKKSDYSVYLGARNRIWTYIKNYPTRVLIKKLPIFMIIQLATILKYAMKGKPHLILKSQYHAIKNVKTMLIKRKQIQNMAKISPYQFEALMI